MKNAFTLIELLVVMIIISFIISLVAPAGYRLYEGVQKFISDKKDKDKIEDLKFNSFIKQQKNREYNLSIFGDKIDEES